MSSTWRTLLPPSLPPSLTISFFSKEKPMDPCVLLSLAHSSTRAHIIGDIRLSGTLSGTLPKLRTGQGLSHQATAKVWTSKESLPIKKIQTQDTFIEFTDHRPVTSAVPTTSRVTKNSDVWDGLRRVGLRPRTASSSTRGCRLELRKPVIRPTLTGSRGGADTIARALGALLALAPPPIPRWTTEVSL